MYQRPVGQAVKTAASHAANMGSIPVRVTTFWLTRREKFDKLLLQQRVGVDCSEGPPVPIPNTEVKLSGAEDTWLVTAWENREMPTQTRGLREGVVLLYSSLAQSVEHAAVNRRVVGSSPTGGARKSL